MKRWAIVVFVIASLTLAVTGTLIDEKPVEPQEKLEYSITLIDREEAESERVFVERVMEIAISKKSYDTTFHKTSLAVKTVKGYVVTQRLPEIYFVSGIDSKVSKAVIVWINGFHKYPLRYENPKEGK